MNRKRHSHRIRIGFRPEYEYKVESETETRDHEIGVVIFFPKNDSVISSKPDEPRVITRPIKGKVFGFGERDIEKLELAVKVSIKTDKWYDQGVAKVYGDGNWILDNARFGGTVHRIRAVLSDTHGKERAVAEAITTVKR